MAQQCSLANFDLTWQMESDGPGEVHGAPMVGSPCFTTDYYSHRAETQELMTENGQSYRFKPNTTDQLLTYVGLTPFHNPPRRIYRINQDCVIKDYLYITSRTEPGLGGPGFDLHELVQWGIAFKEQGFDPTTLAFPIDPNNASGYNGFDDVNDDNFEYDANTEVTLLRENDNIILEIDDTVATVGAGWVTGGGKKRWTYSRQAWETAYFEEPWILEDVLRMPINPNPTFGQNDQGLEFALYQQPNYAALRLAILPFGAFGLYDVADAGLHDVYFCSEEAAPSEKIDCDQLVT